MFKRNILVILVITLLETNAANALAIYYKDGYKVDLNGLIDGRHKFSSEIKEKGDESYISFGLKGETQIAKNISGYARLEHEINIKNTEYSNNARNRTYLAFIGLKFSDYGSFDYGRNESVINDINNWTNIQPIFVGDTIFNTDNFMNALSTGQATYRNNNLFGLVDGVHVAIQYKSANKVVDLKNKTGEGFAVSFIHNLGYGITLGTAYSAYNGTDAQKTGKQAGAWNIGAKYDDNDLYLAAIYAETRNMTYYDSSSDNNTDIAPKTKNIALVARYQLDFGLQPFFTYVQSKGRNLGKNGSDGNQDLLKYMTVGSVYNFHENLIAYINCKIIFLKKNDFYKKNGINTKDIIGVGVSYQF